ncbi:MAG: oxygen-independent coproporphyrinogen III oxidase [Halieaceae bacterium]|jgi:oxygen-independent coproporphyrinogen-3 oxidase|nr:oxygen-independent coproporphyrinogen III oxidase [Halieaceae bacterium]
MIPDVSFDEDLIGRYDRPGPRYTSYPTAVQFDESYGLADYQRNVDISNATGAALSLYFHLPFCSTICYYCACNKVVTRDRSKAIPYLDHLHREIAMQAAMFDEGRPVNQLHWGGGTPTFIDEQQMRELMAVTRRHFYLLDDDRGEYSIEIDPREVDRSSIGVLRDIGFNRLSLGVQDFDPDVQKAVNRLQSDEETWGAVNAAREEGFNSISMDLIYGLPRQSVDSFAITLDKIISISPDRISVFNYAHMPQMFKTQRGIREAELPSAAEKLKILKLSIEKLTAAGYVFIGMDHFAKPDDELAVAQKAGKLHRNFQGYATHADCDLIGLGISAIGKVGNSFVQNEKTLDAYYQRIDSGELPILRGTEMTADDDIRRDVIMQLICQFELDIDEFEKTHGLVFADYFARELGMLAEFEADGLLAMNRAGISVTARGRLLIRNICMVFDRYLAQPSEQQRFSKAI